MKKINVNLKNCYGIESFDNEFSFIESNVNVLYARNGLMKTSFAKVFKKIQEDKENDIKDEIFGREPIVKEIKINGKDIQKEDVFVIQSFENAYESDNIGYLLIKDDLKNELNKVLNLRDNFFKYLADKSGLKITRKPKGKTVFELETTLINDLGFKENSFLLNLDKVDLELSNYVFSNIKYSDIFTDSILKKIKSDEFQKKIF